MFVSHSVVVSVICTLLEFSNDYGPIFMKFLEEVGLRMKNGGLTFLAICTLLPGISIKCQKLPQ